MAAKYLRSGLALTALWARQLVLDPMLFQLVALEFLFVPSRKAALAAFVCLVALVDQFHMLLQVAPAGGHHWAQRTFNSFAVFSLAILAHAKVDNLCV